MKLYVLVTALILQASCVTGGHSHGWECRDMSKCLTRQECSNNDALYRAGHLCHDFPGYNGGPPLFETLKWDSEFETYVCRQAEGHACLSWTTREDSPGEFEVGFGKCTALHTDKGYCMEWEVQQDEVDYCKSEEWEHGVTRELIDGSRVHIQCCKNVCDDENNCWVECRYREIEREIAKCECVTEGPINADGKAYCAAWKCVERDNNGHKAAEYEDYRCTLPHPQHPFCQEWSGTADSREEFKMSDCKCEAHISDLREVNQTTHCTRWVCEEDGTNYHYPNLDWIAFSVLFGLFVWFLMIFTFAVVANCTSRRIALICVPPIALLVIGGTVFIPSALRGGIIVLLVAVGWILLLACSTAFVLINRGSSKEFF